jgi:hypothetical protein
VLLEHGVGGGHEASEPVGEGDVELAKSGDLVAELAWVGHAAFLAFLAAYTAA